MSLFKKTYQDNLRTLKKEQAKIVPTIVEEIDPFEAYVTELYNDDLEPIEPVFLFKKNFAKIKHSYQLPIPLNAKFTRRTNNKFESVEAILPTILPECKSVDSDFLTGYYLAKFHLNIPQIMTSFHAGISKDSMIQGMYHAVLKLRPKAKWQMFGCDAHPIQKYKNISKNGIRLPCDVYDINTSNSINLQLSESILYKSVDLYTCDIRSNSAADLLKQLILIREYLTNDARLVLRLPLNWNSCYTAMQTILLFCASQFKTIKVFKTPWGSIPKYYLILNGFKELINTQKHAILRTYLDALNTNPNIPLISSTYFDIDKDNRQIFMQNISQAYINMLKFEDSYTSDETLLIWTDMV